MSVKAGQPLQVARPPSSSSSSSSSFAQQQFPTGRAWPIATSANTVYDVATATLRYCPTLAISDTTLTRPPSTPPRSPPPQAVPPQLHRRGSPARCVAPPLDPVNASSPSRRLPCHGYNVTFHTPYSPHAAKAVQRPTAAGPTFPLATPQCRHPSCPDTVRGASADLLSERCRPFSTRPASSPGVHAKRSPALRQVPHVENAPLLAATARGPAKISSAKRLSPAPPTVSVLHAFYGAAPPSETMGDGYDCSSSSITPSSSPRRPPFTPLDLTDSRDTRQRSCDPVPQLYTHPHHQYHHRPLHDEQRTFVRVEPMEHICTTQLACPPPEAPTFAFPASRANASSATNRKKDPLPIPLVTTLPLPHASQDAMYNTMSRSEVSAPPSAGNIDGFVPSLQLAQHRHVRHIISDLSRTTPPASQRVLQLQRPSRTFAAGAWQDTSSSRTTETDGGDSNLISGRCQGGSRSGTWKGFTSPSLVPPAGSPYVAAPTYAVGMPHQRRRPRQPRSLPMYLPDTSRPTEPTSPASTGVAAAVVSVGEPHRRPTPDWTAVLRGSRRPQTTPLPQGSSVVPPPLPSPLPPSSSLLASPKRSERRRSVATLVPPPPARPPCSPLVEPALHAPQGRGEAPYSFQGDPCLPTEEIASSVTERRPSAPPTAPISTPFSHVPFAAPTSLERREGWDSQADAKVLGDLSTHHINPPASPKRGVMEVSAALSGEKEMAVRLPPVEAAAATLADQLDRSPGDVFALVTSEVVEGAPHEDSAEIGSSASNAAPHEALDGETVSGDPSSDAVPLKRLWLAEEPPSPHSKASVENRDTIPSSSPYLHSIDGDDLVRLPTSEKRGLAHPPRSYTDGLSKDAEVSEDTDGQRVTSTEHGGGDTASSVARSSASEEEQELTETPPDTDATLKPAEVPAAAVSETTPSTDANDELFTPETAVGEAPSGTGPLHSYVDPLEEACMDATYMLDILEQQYVRISDETNEEMEDLVHVVELNRRDRADGTPRHFMSKGIYSDVLPMLRYPTMEEADAPGFSSAPSAGHRGLSNGNGTSSTPPPLTYRPLSDAAYLNLCVMIWLCRFQSEQAPELLNTAQGVSVDVADNEADQDGFGAHLPGQLLARLDARLSSHVHNYIHHIRTENGLDTLSFEAVCVRLSDRNNIGCLPPSVWGKTRATNMLSFVDHVTNVLLSATVPQEAKRRRSVARKTTPAAEAEARLTWAYFLGAAPWNYEEVSVEEAHIPMPTAAARLAYAYLYKARMRNLDGGLGSFMFSLLSGQVPEAAVLDALLMQEKLRLALLNGSANIVSCLPLRQQMMQQHRRFVDSPKGRREVSSRSNTSVPPDDASFLSAPKGSTPVLYTCLNLHDSVSAAQPQQLSGTLELSSDAVRSSHDERIGDAVRQRYRHLHSGEDGVDISSEEAASPLTSRTIANTCRFEDTCTCVDLYTTAVQLHFFFPAKTERGMRQLCTALIEDLVAMDVVPVPEEVVTSDGQTLTDPTSIVDALVVEGAEAMCHVIMSLSSAQEEVPPETRDDYGTPDGAGDSEALWAAMEQRVVPLDPAVLHFLGTAVPVNDLFDSVVTEHPLSMQPQPTGRKSTFVEVLRLQHFTETVQYTMEMQDCLLFTKMFDHLVASAAPWRNTNPEKQRSGSGRHCPVLSADEEAILHTSPPSSLTGLNEVVVEERTAASHTSLDGAVGDGEAADEGNRNSVSLRSALIALCYGDQGKPLAEVQAYLRHLLVLYFESYTLEGAAVNSNDPKVLTEARRRTVEMSTWNWFGDTAAHNGTLRPGARPACCDKVRVNAEELAALCPRVLGRRVGLVPTVIDSHAVAGVVEFMAAPEMPVAHGADLSRGLQGSHEKDMGEKEKWGSARRATRPTISAAL